MLRTVQAIRYHVRVQGTAIAAEFHADPDGRYLIGEHWIHLCASPDIYGVVLWGRPNARSVERLVESLAIELEDRIPPHRSFVDASRVRSVDADAFALLSRYVSEHASRLAVQVQELALIRPPGLPGAVATGFYGVTGAPYRVVIREQLEPALTALGVPDPAALGRLIEKVANDASGNHPPLPGLRAIIRADLCAELEFAGIAKDLGMSERSLQRRLKELGTTFQTEVLGVRIEESQHRMLDTDASLTVIAADVGFTSLQHFSTQFRKHTGETPSQWRARNS